MGAAPAIPVGVSGWCLETCRHGLSSEEFALAQANNCGDRVPSEALEATAPALMRKTEPMLDLHRIALNLIGC